MIDKTFLHKVRNQIIGINTKVPLINGKRIKYINFDNAASTPSFKRVAYKVKEFLYWYSNVHRGTGFKSQISTKIYDEVHDLVANFFGVDTKNNTIIFVKNTTEAINKLSNSLNLSPKDIIITTPMEHHSNLLPWRDKSKVIYINLDQDGRLDLDDLEEKLKEYKDQIKLVAISGASNVTGYINPIHKIAKLVHNYDSKILVDAAQLAPHRPIDVKDDTSSEHIDYLVFSAHKLYAPFGTGVLIAPKSTFAGNKPDYTGGGTVKAVTLDDVIWAGLPDKEEAGTPNIVGALALGESIQLLNKLEWEKIIQNEDYLSNYTLKQLRKIDEVILYGTMKSDTTTNQVGVIPFNIKGIENTLVASILANEFGIGVRNGCFCAHPYIHHLFGLSDQEIEKVKGDISKGIYTHKYGLIRISFGCYNTLAEVDRLIYAVKDIIARKKAGIDLTTNYEFDNKTAEYKPKNNINYSKYFKL
ncbi:aminotransferase class V-fold PLP-dependent enzyme [Orenia marismortui]|uniref:Selenocysteine lyase/cysteine desulfurase n=1 Tax=Orenia marismortui TaxID=46469 RepID=A0A4R8HR61_9FIRM|nr:aminotransferase class V-fold PLP-dependent enzyme [Orenia marismortui]TDX59313.1 selenocysteine lyase/cysteine desulfurase [Orenia marismortui]